MKRMSMCVAAALVAALAMGTMGGCGSQSDSSSGASDSSASTTTEQSQDDIITELKEAIANVPAFKSVTVTEEDQSTINTDADDSSASDESTDADESSEADDVSDTIKATSVYKFDESGDKIKTSVDAEIGGTKLQYFTDGDDAVFVSDKSVYSGTVDQFELEHAKGLKEYLNYTIGDLDTLVDCAASVEKTETHGLTYYTVTLDADKYIASDEILTLMADDGTPVKEALLTICFEEDGRIGALDLAVTYEGMATEKHLVFTDYDKTIIDPMPEADKTYEQMEEDMQSKLESFEDQAESDDAAQS